MDFAENLEIYSAYPNYAGQEIAWLDTDTEKRFRRNRVDIQKRAMLEEFGWDKRNPTYKINSNGFRSPEFKKGEDNIVFLGCSHTVGVGVKLSDSFSHLVSQSLGLQNYNLGQGGGSMQTAFRIGHHWIPKLKPKIVVLMGPEKTRSEIIMGDTPVPLGAHTRETNFRLWNYIKLHLSNDENIRLDFLAHKLALEKISADVGARFIGLESEHDIILPEDKTIFDWGRDLSHHGRLTHKHTAEHILSKIQKA